MSDAEADDELEVTVDTSLRSNGETYVDRNGEATRLIARIEHSSSSVVGIAGARGAGKSSLAKKVLAHCDELGYFSLLIPSPADYDPKEFLITVCQRVAEHCVATIQPLLYGAEDLLARGKRKVSQLRLRMVLTVVGLLVCIGGGLWAYTSSTKPPPGAATAAPTSAPAPVAPQSSILHGAPVPDGNGGDRRKQLATLSAEITRRLRVDQTFSTKFQRLKYDADTLAVSPKLIVGADARKLTDKQLVDDQQMTYKLVDQADIAAAAATAATARSVAGASLALSAVAIFFVAYLAAVIVAFYLYRQFRLYRRVNDDKRVTGLYFRCLDFLEALKYQTTLSSGFQVSLSSKIPGGTWSRSKQLADRPQSLPGMTALCEQLLIDVASVYNGKAVICIDELDKITDLKDLIALLKGIKGLLGVKHTHFIMTISEDAALSFNERYGSGRNMVESSFEEIIDLDRVDFDLARRIAGPILATSELPVDPALSALCWIFGAGIPREIKRCAMVVVGVSTAGGPTHSPFVAWKRLFVDMLEHMTTLLERDAEAKSQVAFLLAVEQLTALINGVPDNASVGLLLSAANQIIWGEPKRTEPAAIEGWQAIYIDQIVQILIGTRSYGLVTTSAAQENGGALATASSLVNAYRYVPVNPLYAYHCLCRPSEASTLPVFPLLQALDETDTGAISSAASAPAVGSSAASQCRTS